MSESLDVRAKGMIAIGKTTGADGGGKSPWNIYVVAAELLARANTAEQALADMKAERALDRAEEGRVYVNVSGLTGTGKSAVMGEIEIALKALGLTVEYGPDFHAEKNATHADWQEALDLYKPTVVLNEINVARLSNPGAKDV